MGAPPRRIDKDVDHAAMRTTPITLALLLACATSLPGCRSGGASTTAKAPAPADAIVPVAIEPVAYEEPVSDELTPPAEDDGLVVPPVLQPELIPTPDPIVAPSIDELILSVQNHFPAIQQAIAGRTVASGEALAARGAFDHKLEGYSNSQPLDFYENYRHRLGLKQDTYWGGQTFAGYRLGRGVYEPWYLERETNKGGEFNAGFIAPLARDRFIDANRAELWRSQLEQNRVEPEIRAMVIASVRDAKVAYWQWVAASAAHRVAGGVLQLGLDRIGFLERQVELGEKAEIDLVDNQRIIVSRRAKQIDARRKLEQSAVKLSLFLRDATGQPTVLPLAAADIEFPNATSPEAWDQGADIDLARANRPELEELRIAQQQLRVLLRQACNETQPEIDAGLLVAQDVGEPTSLKRDKSELELEASVTLSVPLQRRKALGKARQLRGKIAQLRAKTRFAADKIGAEAQAAHAALIAASERVEQTTEGLELAERMQSAEQRLYELGQSTLLNLNLREQQAAEAALARVSALADYHIARTDYAAALGLDTLEALSER